MQVLVVAAHPDDEVLGLGGTLARHSKRGDRVTVCIATRALLPRWSEAYRARKVREQRQVDRRLGIAARVNLGLATTTLNTRPGGELAERVGEVLARTRPGLVYAHFPGDVHGDHAALSRAVLVATRPPRRIRLLWYETPSETEWGTLPFAPNYWVALTARQFARKLAAFRCYRSEVKPAPHPRSGRGLRALAARRGAEICAPYAEAFMLSRDWWPSR